METNMLWGLILLAGSIVLLLIFTGISIYRINHISKKNIKTIRDFVNERKN